MGASTPYVIFAGLAESGAALLLLFRRTALLGALSAAAVLLNVAMLNYCYDVPVKLYSTNLLLMALFLLTADVSRLANMFFFNRTILPAEMTAPLFAERWMRLGAGILKLVLFGYFIGTAGWQGWNSLQPARSAGNSPVYGAYEVDSMTNNGLRAPAGNSSTAWRRVIIESTFWAVRQTDGTNLYLQPHFDEKAKMVDLYSWKTHSRIKLSYEQPDAQHLMLTNKTGNGDVEARLHRLDTKPFTLTSRGYHWINEQPFNQ
jgi:hypothetical protein